MFLNELLSLLILAPLFSVCIISLLPKEQNFPNNKYTQIALWTNIFIILMSLFLIYSSLNLDKSLTLFQSTSMIMKYFSINLISAIMVLLTCLISTVGLIIGSTEIVENKKIFSELILILENLCMILFLTNDIVIFYCCFEAILFPMFLLIGINTKHYFIGTKFTIILLIGSVFMLIGTATIVAITGETNFAVLANSYFSHEQKIFLFVCFFLGLGFKTAVFPLHIWLPDAHSMAPTSASVILSGIFLKIGTYGFLAILCRIFKDIFPAFSNYIYVTSIIGILICGYAAYIQTNFKRIIAYISIIHMNIIMIGIITGSKISLAGAVFSMISHSLTSVGLFTVAFILKENFKDISLSGIYNKYPIFGIVSIIIFLANISFPFTSSFIGEFVILYEIITKNLTITLLLTSIMAASIFFIFKVYKNIFFGYIQEEQSNIITNNELHLTYIIVFFILYLGCAPKYLFLNLLKAINYYF